MENWFVSAITGVALVGAGIALMFSHRSAWRRQQNDPALSDAERKHLYARYRRRMQTSAILALLGVLIPVGDLLIPWQNRPGLFALYWGMLILLSLWVIVLGVGDAISTAARSRSELARIRRKQRELQQQVAEIRRRHSNGRDSAGKGTAPQMPAKKHRPAKEDNLPEDQRP